MKCHGISQIGENRWHAQKMNGITLNGKPIFKDVNGNVDNTEMKRFDKPVYRSRVVEHAKDTHYIYINKMSRPRR